jgi:predicted nucleic acid-binding Zn ribbon protein
MDRAGKLIARLQMPPGCLASGELACAAWPLAVGKRLAARTRAAGLRESTLVVEVEDAIWQGQLYTLRNQILAKLKETLGRELVRELEFRVRIPRRQPQLAEQASSQGGDEADGIRDPALRWVYRTSRTRSSA